MALTYTPTAEMDSKLPEFTLPTVDGKSWSTVLLKNNPAAIIVFMCNHCPYVQAIEDRLIALARHFAKISVPLIGICSNDPEEYPEDSPKELLRQWKEKEYGFTYLVDADQSVAQSFGAVCTPDFFVYDGAQRLKYRGRLDDSWKNPTKVQSEELKEAVEKIVNKKPIPVDLQRPSMGCSIKWKKT